MAIIDPTDIANLAFWGDPDNVVENPSGFIETMTNREGTTAENLNQSVENKRPALISAFGKTGARFEASVTFDEALVGIAGASTTGTIVLVLKLPSNNPGVNQLIWAAEDNDETNRPAIWRDDDDVRIIVGKTIFGEAAFTVSPDSDWTWGDFVVLTMTWSTFNNDMFLRINGIAKGGPGNLNQLSVAAGITLGATSVPNFGIDMDVFGLVMYSSILTGVDLTDIEEYMTNTYLPVSVLTADAGPDQTIDADESNLGLVILDGTDSSGPLAITNYEWKEGTTVLQSDPSPILIALLSVGIHTLTLTVTDANLDTDADTVQITVTAFVPPTPPTIRTFKEITGSTDKVHAFNDVFPLTPEVIAPTFTKFHNQLRLFKKDVADVVTELFPVGRPSSTGKTDFIINAAGTSITLDAALVATDTLVIMRETQINRSFVRWINVARFRGRDRNVLGNQILFVAQELREIRLIADILGSDTGELFEYDPAPIDRSGWNQVFTGDGATTSFSYSDIEMLPLEAVRHAPQLLVFVDNVLQTTGITITESTLLVTFDVAPVDGAFVEIRRNTRIDKRWVSFVDGSTFSSLQDRWDFLNIKFIAEETQDFPAFLLPNPLSNRIFPRPLNILTFSGPGDRFFFGNLPWFGDGTVFIFKNDLQLTEDVDYTIDFIFFFITLTVPLVSSDTLVIITTTPNCAFKSLCYNFPGGQKNAPEDEPLSEQAQDQGIKNAWLVNAAPNTNIDEPSQALIFVRPSGGVTFPLPHYVSVIEFDVTDIDPADFSEVRVSFVLLGEIQTGDVNIFIRRSLRKWVIPNEITWNEWKSGSAWAVAGAQGVDMDYDSASEITWSTTGPAPAIGNVWLTPDVSTLILEARADDSILRLIFFPDDPIGIWTVGSIDNPFADNRPRLITYL